jgi:hypothetical protein
LAGGHSLPVGFSYIPTVDENSNVYSHTSINGRNASNFTIVGSDGSIKHQVEFLGHAVSSPAISTSGDAYFQTNGSPGNLIAYDSTAQVKWTLDIGGAQGSPAIDGNGVIYFVNSSLYAINPDGTIKWSISVGGSSVSSPAIGIDGTIFIGCGTAMCAVGE